MKRFITLLLVVLVCISLVACSETYNKWNREQIESYGFVVTNEFGVYGESGAYLVYDPATKVQYIVTAGPNGDISLCPYYNKDGNISFYGGD